jgi:hypothetical protein
MKTLRLTIIFINLISISLIFAGKSYARIDPKTCVGIWLFDEGSGEKVKDSSGNKRDGKLMKTPKWMEGKFGKALEFDFNANNYVIVPISHSNSITVAMWAKYKSLPTGNSGLFHAQATEDPDGAPETKIVGIWVENTKLLWGRLIQPDGTKINFPKNKQLESDRWYHIALTADEKSKKGKEWLDGELAGEVDYNGKLADFSFAKIGRQGTETWTGAIDEVGVFNQALAVEDIKTIMTQGLEKVLITPVFPLGKLSTSWGNIKFQ